MAFTEGKGKFAKEKEMGVAKGGSRAGKKFSFPASASLSGGLGHSGTGTKGSLGLDLLAPFPGQALLSLEQGNQKKVPPDAGVSPSAAADEWARPPAPLAKGDFDFSKVLPGRH